MIIILKEEILANLKIAVLTLARMKVSDIVVLDLRGICSFTDYFVIGSAASTRQVKSVCDEINDALKGEKVLPLHIEGYPEGNWVILDYCDFVIHIFFEDTRNYYNIERLWGDAQRIQFQEIAD